MSGREIELKRFEGFINSTCCYNFNHKIAELARTHLHLMPRITFCGDETIFNQLFPKHEYRKFDILMEGTNEYIKYKAEEKDRKNKEEREKKKLNEETISTLLWSIEDKRKADELAKNIINRDRHGFDDESFKGMKRILSTSIALAILMVCHVASVSAQIRGNNIVVSIAPDQRPLDS